MNDTAIIRQLHIERFRGIKELTWNPAPGMNVILGGGDVGKTTVLEAIALLLSPTNTLVLSEAEYWQKETDDGFLIRAVMSLPPSTDVNHQRVLSWPWEWDGKNAVLPVTPDGEDDLPAPAEPVYCLQVRGTPELEIAWEIAQPSEETDSLSSSLRRQIGVVRLGGEDRNDRDLRLVYGSALDRLLADPGLRARISQEVAKIDLQANLTDDAKTALTALDKTLKDEALPNNLNLGLTSSQGLSIGALVGLLAQSDEEIALPLASWGAGTRRMVTLQIAASTQARTRITVIDEIERGLEPYRARKLVKALQEDETQCFVTTHSPVVIGAGANAQLWYMDAAGALGELDQNKIKAQQRRDPITFLTRLSLVCEGQTEVGFVSFLLEKAIEGHHTDHGLHITDGEGNASTLALLQAMAGAGLQFAGFADDEGDAAGRWAALKAHMGARLFQWQAGHTEANVIGAIPEGQLLGLMPDESGEKDGVRRRTLADRLGCKDKDIQSLETAINAQGTSWRELIIAAASGSTENLPREDKRAEWKSHGKQWFKTEAGGRELAAKMFALGAWPTLRPHLMPFLNAIRAALGQEEIGNLPDE